MNFICFSRLPTLTSAALMPRKDKPVPPNARFGFLRPARQAKERTVTDVAHQLKITPAFLSGIERGLSAPANPEDFLQRYAVCIGHKPEHFLHHIQPTTGANLAGKIIRELSRASDKSVLPAKRKNPNRNYNSRTNLDRELSNYLARFKSELTPNDIRHRLESVKASEFAGTEQVVVAAVQLLRKALRHHKRQEQSIYITFKNVTRNLYEKPIVSYLWWHLLREAILKGYRVHHIWSPINDAASTTRFLLNTLRCLALAGRRHPLHKNKTPYDTHLYRGQSEKTNCEYLIIPEVGSLILFATSSARGIDAAIYLPPDCSHALPHHWHLLKVQQTAPLMNIRSRTEYTNWHEDLVASERSPGHRYLMAPFLTTFTVPKAFFTPGHHWSNFHTKRTKALGSRSWVQSELDRINAIEQRVRANTYQFRQICSMRALDYYVQSGALPYAPHTKEYNDMPRRRLERISRTLELLELPGFEIALADRDQESAFGLHALDINDPTLNWQVASHEKVWMERWTAKNSNRATFFVDISDSATPNEFENFFHQKWNGLPTQLRDKRAVMEYLRAKMTSIAANGRS